MKRIQLITIVAAMSAVVCTTQAGVEKPAVVPEAMLSITVSDLHGFLDEVGLVASKASPMMSGAMMKNMIGMQINDPGLAGIPAGKGVSIVALDLNTIFGVLEVSEAKSALYLEAATNMNIQAKYTEGVLLIAQTAEALGKGEAALGSVTSSVLSKRAPTLNVAAKPAAMIELNRASIDGMLAMMPMMMSQGMMQQPGATLESVQSTTKILQAETGVLLSLAEQCEVAEIVLAPKGGNIALSETFVAKTGTELAKLVNAPVVYKPNPAIHSGGFGGGTMLYDFQIGNPEALGAFFAVEVDKLMKSMAIEGVDSDALLASLLKWVKIYGGSGCERVDLGSDKLAVEYVVEVRDEAVAMEALRNMEKDFAPCFKLYESFGMPMTLSFKENAREANGVKIHELHMSLQFEGMMAEQSEQMKQMGMDNLVYELAFVDGSAFYSTRGGMEALLAKFQDGAAKSAAPIAARKQYPAGGFYYFDLDMADYMAFVVNVMPADPSSAAAKQQIPAIFKDVPPIVSAGFKEGDRVQWSVTIPGDLIAKFSQFAMVMQMQKMQQQQQMGAPVGPTP